MGSEYILFEFLDQGHRIYWLGRLADSANIGRIDHAVLLMDAMPLKLGFQTNHILNPWSIHFDSLKVSVMAFAILFEFVSAFNES